MAKHITNKPKLLDELAGLPRFYELFAALVRTNITLQYHRPLIGVLWATLQSLVLTAIFYVVLKSQLGSNIESYFVFLLIGFSVWSFFAGAATAASQSFLTHRAMIRKAAFPLILLPAAGVAARLFDLLLISAVLIAGLLAASPQANWLLVVVALVLAAASTAVFALGIGVLLALLTVKFREVKVLVVFLIQLILFASPVFYSAQFLASSPPIVRWIFHLNPIAGAIGLVRDAASGTPLDWNHFFSSGLTGLALLMVALAAYGWYGKKIPDHI